MKHDSMASDGKKTVRTAAMNTIANAAALVAGVVVMPILARVLTQEELGIASTFVANRNIIVIVVTFAIYAFVNKAMLEFCKDKPAYVKTISLYCILAVAVVFLISLPFKQHIQQLLSMDDFLFYWLFVSMLAYSLYMIADYYCIFHNFAKTVFSIAILVGPVAQVLSVVIAFLMPSDKFIGRVVGLDIIYLIVSAVLLVWVFVILRKTKMRMKYVSSSLRFSIPLIPHLLSQVVLTQCDLVMITAMVGADASGIYSMGHTIGFLAFTVMTQVLAAWSPWVYRRLDEGNLDAIRSNFKLVLVLGIILSLGLLAISPELVDIFLPESYGPAKLIIPALVVAMFMQFCYIFFYDVEYYRKRTSLIAVASITAAVLNLILNFVFIPRIGFLAACYTTLFSYFVLFFMNYLFSRRLEVHRVYDVRYFFVAIIAMLLYMFVSLAFLNNLPVRYVLFIIVGTILFLRYRNVFLEIAKALLPDSLMRRLRIGRE